MAVGGDCNGRGGGRKRVKYDASFRCSGEEIMIAISCSRFGRRTGGIISWGRVRAREGWSCIDL